MEFKLKKVSEYNNAGNLSNYGCAAPFRYLEIHSSGEVSACCFAWLPQFAGNVLTDSTHDIINNSKRKEIQDKMYEGNFEFCNDQCPRLSNLLSGSSNHYGIFKKEDLASSLDSIPMHISFSYDESCNLQCPSCRNTLIMHDPNNPDDISGQKVRQVHEKVKTLVTDVINQYKKVILTITGSGDAFASPIFWEYLLELADSGIPEHVMIILKTNGIMMTEENLNKIKSLWKHIYIIDVSVDAATEEVYKIVRKNGNFKRLKNNLDILDRLICNGSFPNLTNWQTNMIVQKDNYKELKQFCEWQLSYKSKPKIWTNLIAQWGHISSERFKGIAIWQAGHPERQDLVEILEDPIFKNPQIKLGNLTALMK